MLSGAEKVPPEVRQWLMENTRCVMMVWYDLDGCRELTAVIRNNMERDALMQGFKHIITCNEPTYIRDIHED